MRTVFMGNPSFAIPTLKAIIQSEHELIAVVSNPPKRIGRGRSLSHTPVGKFSQDNKIPLIESQDLRSDELKNELHILSPWCSVQNPILLKRNWVFSSGRLAV